MVMVSVRGEEDIGAVMVGRSGREVVGTGRCEYFGCCYRMDWLLDH